MSERDSVQTTFDEFGKSIDGKRRSGSWYRRGEDAVVVLNLQKSNYSTRYYVNIAVWLLALGENYTPKESKCQVRTRLTRLVPSDVEAEVNDILDLAVPLDDDVRRDKLRATLEQYVRPSVDAAMTLDGLHSVAGQALINRSLVSGPAEQVLADFRQSREK